MKTTTLVIAAGMAGLLALPPAPAEAAWVCGLKRGKALNLRACASGTCRVLGAYRNGTKLDALAARNNFINVRVKRDRKKGWMWEPLLCGDDIDFG
jgi:hypothetical protein